MAECVRHARRLGIIRPSTRLRIQAPEIPQDLLTPLPKDTTLCRQPHYRHETRSDTPTSPEIEVHPQRDRIVEILMQREARLKAASRQTKAKPPAKPIVTPTTPKTGTMDVSPGRVAMRPLPPVQPDPNRAFPPWSFLHPLVASL